MHARPVTNEPFFVLMSWGAGQHPPCQSKDPRAVTELPTRTAGLLSILQNSGLTQYKKNTFYQLVAKQLRQSMDAAVTHRNISPAHLGDGLLNSKLVLYHSVRRHRPQTIDESMKFFGMMLSTSMRPVAKFE